MGMPSFRSSFVYAWLQNKKTHAYWGTNRPSQGIPVTSVKLQSGCGTGARDLGRSARLIQTKLRIWEEDLTITEWIPTVAST